MSEPQTESDTPGGVLVCMDCGEAFYLEDGTAVLIDHFAECDGNE
jgi:uncharacterized protein YbaR (Trm112 family)